MADKHLNRSAFVQWLNTVVAVNNVHDTVPTAAELVTSFGAVAGNEAGFIGVVNDAGAGTNCYLVISDGTSYFYLKFTKAL